MILLDVLARANALLKSPVFVAALIAFSGVVIKWVLDVWHTRDLQAQQRRAAFTRFYTDLDLRIKDLAKFADDRGLAERIETLKIYRTQGKKFKFYVVQVSDLVGQELVSNQLFTITKNDAFAVREFIELDRLFVAAYEKLGSHEFEDLSVDRQIAVTTDCFDLAKKLTNSAEVLKPILEQYQSRHVKFTESWWRLPRGKNRSDHEGLQ